MNSARKQDDSVANELNTESIEAATNNTDPHISDERRHHPDSKARDRRVILRLGHPEMRAYFRHISNICRVWVGLSGIYIVAMILGNLSGGKIAVGRSLFYGFVTIISAISIYKFERSVRSYLNSESQEKLVNVVERLFQLLFVSLILSAVMGAVYIISLF